MKTTKHIDWISVSILDGSSATKVLPECEWRLTGEGGHGWKVRYDCMKTDIYSEEQNPREDMPNHITMSGHALSAYRVLTYKTDQQIIDTLWAHKGRPSRLDLCVNIHGGKLTPRQCYKAFKSGKASSPIRKRYIIEGTDENFDGDTLYLGSKESQAQVRIYDKNAERKIKSNERWMRIEFQLRDERAQMAYNAIAHSSVEAVINSLMSEYIIWDNPEIEAAMSGPLAEIQEVGRKVGNTAKWLLDTCAKALASEMIKDERILDMFLQNVYTYKRAKDDELMRLSGGWKDID